MQQLQAPLLLSATRVCFICLPNCMFFPVFVPDRPPGFSTFPQLQLTDEASGDNPAEPKTRDEHQILPSDVSE